MDQTQVVEKLLLWIEDYAGKPHPSIGGRPPCPFARLARLSRNNDVIGSAKLVAWSVVINYNSYIHCEGTLKDYFPER